MHFVFEGLQLLGRRLGHLEDLDRHVSVPLALEDGPEGTRTDPLLDGHLPRVDLPVVTGISVTPSVLGTQPGPSQSRDPAAKEGEKNTLTTFFLSSDEEGLRSLCSEGDLGGRRPGEPREAGGLVESLGDGSGPASTNQFKKKQNPAICNRETIPQKAHLPNMLLNLMTS